MRELNILFSVVSTLRLRANVIERRPLFGPNTRMRRFEPIAHHRLFTQRTSPILSGPKALKQWRFGHFEGLAHAVNGAGHPRR